MTKRRVGSILLTIAAVIAIAVFGFVLAILFSSIDVTLDEDAFTLKCLYHTETVAYEDVEKVELSYVYASERVLSFGGISKAFGKYENEDFGEHYRLTYEENAHNYIIVTKKDGTVTVFNQKTEPKTAELYEKIREKLVN